MKIRLKSDGSGAELANVKMSINPSDEISVEEALRPKEAGKAEEMLRTALIMGADRAILIESDETIESLSIAKLLEGIAEVETPCLFRRLKRA